MRYSTTINNKAIHDNELDVNLTEAYTLQSIIDICHHWWTGMEKIEYKGKLYFFLSYSMIQQQAFFLSEKKKDTIYRILNKLVTKGFLLAHPRSKSLKKPFYALTEKCALLTGSPIPNHTTEKNPMSENDYGKKSDVRESTTEKNPMSLFETGKKSVLTTEKNPMDNNNKIDKCIYYQSNKKFEDDNRPNLHEKSLMAFYEWLSEMVSRGQSISRSRRNATLSTFQRAENHYRQKYGLEGAAEIIENTVLNAISNNWKSILMDTFKSAVPKESKPKSQRSTERKSRKTFSYSFTPKK